MRRLPLDDPAIIYNTRPSIPKNCFFYKKKGRRTLLH
jgi:hypothetical protein